MISVYKYEATDEDSCYEKCIEDLDVYASEILVSANEEEDSYSMEVVKKDDVKDFIKEYIKTIGTNMGVDIQLEVRDSEDVFNVTMVSNNNPIVIGKEGRTIDSLQLLLRQSLQNQTKIQIKVNLDASNYKAKKMKRFEYEIKNVVRDVQRTKTEAKLDAMNSYQRRAIHALISDYSNVETESRGEEPNRYVVIKYKGE